MDNTLTARIGAFLQLEHPSDQQIIEAATMLLQCNPSGERGIYNSALRRPQAMLPWVRTDLKKYYNIRQRGLTTEQVPAYNADAMKKVRETLSILPKDIQKEAVPQVPVLGVRGKRADHDQLPDTIKVLWDKNTERWKTIRKLHNQLLVMISKPGYQPCDGNELCHLLREADTQLRAAYKTYDSFVIVPATPDTAADSVDVFTDNVKTVTNARSTITRGLQRKTQDDVSRQKIQAAVDTLKALNQKLMPATIEKLKAIGVNA